MNSNKILKIFCRILIATLIWVASTILLAIVLSALSLPDKIYSSLVLIVPAALCVWHCLHASKKGAAVTSTKSELDVRVPRSDPPVPASELSRSDKERIMVNRVTLDDMKRISALPYRWNCAIKKHIAPHSHPFAYIDLVGENIDIAKNELEAMNIRIDGVHKLCAQFPARLRIPVDKILFTPSKERGYTRLICSPLTFEGEEAQYPASLSFMTDLSSEVSTTHGELIYGHSGHVERATVYFWRKQTGYFLYYVVYEGELVLEKIEYSGPLSDSARPEVIYKAPHIIAIEKLRAQEERDFEWLQENLPAKCPKSLSGYRRMKTQNTKNYRILKQLAAELGTEI